MNKDFINVNITFGTIIKTALFALFLYLLYFFQNLVLIILTAIVLASAIEPLIKRLQKIKIPRTFSVVLVYLFLISLGVGIFTLFVPPLLDQAGSLVKQIPTYIESFDKWTATLIPGAESGFVSRFISDFQISDNSPDGFTKNSSLLTQSIVVLFGSMLNLLLILVLSFYFALQEHGIENFLKIITPVKYSKYAINLWKRSQAKISLWMQGQLVLGLLIGSLTYVGLLVFFGFEQSLLLAILAGFAELIPLVGPFIAATPAVAIGLASGGWELAGAVALFYLVIQQIENQLIYPLVVKKVVGVPSLLVILSLIVGAQLFGFLGVILSVPLAAAFMEYISDVEKRQLEALKKGEEKEVDLTKKSS